MELACPGLQDQVPLLENRTPPYPVGWDGFRPKSSFAVVGGARAMRVTVTQSVSGLFCGAAGG